MWEHMRKIEKKKNNKKRGAGEKIIKSRYWRKRGRQVLLLTPAPSSLTQWSRWASFLLADRLQYRDAAKASGEIRVRTISSRINFSRDAATTLGAQRLVAPTHHLIRFPAQIHGCVALTTHEKVSGDRTFSLMEVKGRFSGMA